MADPTLGSDQLLPYEKGAASPADEGGSFEDLAGAILGEAPTDPDEPTPEAEAEGEPDEVETLATDEGDEPDADTPDSDDEEPDAPPTYRVRVDGQELEVPLPELLAGYSRQADYTRKTTEVANQRKALEAKAAEIGAARDQYAQQLGALEKALAETMPKEPDWDTLRKENPNEFAALRVEHNERKERLAKVRAEQDKVRGEQERDFNARHEAHLQAESEKLLTAIPEWRDEEKSKTEKGKLVEFAATLGMDEEYLDAVSDHRFVLILRDAMRWRDSQTRGKEAIREKIKTAKVLEPGGRPQVNTKNKTKRAEIEKARARLDRTGRPEDAAKTFDYLDEMLG